MPSPPTKPAPAAQVALFAIYLVLLTWVIVWKLEIPRIGEAAFLPHPIKLIPFVPSADADASAPLEVIANVIFFIPFGLFLGTIAQRWQWWKLAGIFVVTSLLFEITQHVLSVGSFDITDVISNTAGGMLGLGLVKLARRRLGERFVPVISRILLGVTLVSALLVAIVVVSPLHYAHTPDVVIER